MEKVKLIEVAKIHITRNMNLKTGCQSVYLVVPKISQILYLFITKERDASY